MPLKSKKRGQDYDSDRGFVTGENGGSKSKKQKTGKITGLANQAGSKDAKKGAKVAGGGAVSSNGEIFWELSDKRRVAVSEFKGKTMVNIREYYEKDGEALPGKKGISMPLEQFSLVVELLPHIEAVLKEKGLELPRPQYAAKGDSNQLDGAEEEDSDEVVKDASEEEEESGKKNFEETSEEEE